MSSPAAAAALAMVSGVRCPAAYIAVEGGIFALFRGGQPHFGGIGALRAEDGNWRSTTFRSGWPATSRATSASLARQ
jgi:hypothetical protein